MARLNNTINRNMYYGASKLIFERAKQLRENPTVSEKKLLEILRKKQILGLRFKFQHPIKIFIADFYCHSIKLVIEVDGNIHNTKENAEYDINRTAELENYGIKVIRFTNNEIEKNISDVKEKIIKECKHLLNK